MNKIILLTGPAGSGKSTVGTHLVGQGYARHKFAYPLKQFCLDYLGMTLEEVDGKDKETPMKRYSDKTPRYIQQTLGTEWGRDTIDPNIWVKAAMFRVKRGLSYNEDAKFVFDDVRFPNEIALMKEAFPDQVMVIDIVPAFEGYEPIEASGHASEGQELKWDHRVTNAGDVKMLTAAIEVILK